jgi:hypothetical protein
MIVAARYATLPGSQSPSMVREADVAADPHSRQGAGADGFADSDRLD